MFIFHQTLEGGWRPTVRPPRLGGNARMGVFATRSTFRPNPLGMSLIELKGVRIKTATWCWSWAASIWSTAPRWWTSSLICRSPRASRRRAGFAQAAPAGDMPVRFAPQAEQQLQQHQARYPQLRRFISQVLAQDPRPAYRKGEDVERDYAVWLLDFNVRWRVVDGHTEVLALDPR